MDHNRVEWYVFSVYNPRKEFDALTIQEKEILELLTTISTFGKIQKETDIEKTSLTFILTSMVKRKLIRAERIDYPCVKCGRECCKLGRCATFPCGLIKEGCNNLYECIVKEKAKGMIK